MPTATKPARRPPVISYTPKGTPLTKAGPEPVEDRDLSDLTPGFRVSVERLVEWLKSRGWKPLITEGWRSEARQAWLYNLGRTTALPKPDGRGLGGRVVTNARSARKSWHPYRVAVDIVDADELWKETARQRRWQVDLLAGCRQFGLRSGMDWDADGQTSDEAFVDAPHVQDVRVPRSPTEQDMADYDAGRVHRVLARYGIAA